MSELSVWFVCAMQSEANTLKRALHEFSLFKPRVVVTGIGAQQVAQTLEELDHTAGQALPTLVVNWGVAGGLSGSLEVADVLLISEVLACDPGHSTAMVRFKPVVLDHLREIQAGRLVSVAQAVATTEQKQQLHTELRADMVDMEAGSVARWCARHNIPWIAIKAISDASCHALPPQLASLIDHQGKPDIAALVLQILRRPGLLGSLWLLGRRFASARDSLRATAEMLAPAIEHHWRDGIPAVHA